MSCSSGLPSLDYVRRENTYSTTVVSQIRLRINACTLLLVMFNAEQLETSLLGPSFHARCAGKLVSASNVCSATHGRKDARDDHNSTQDRHAC